MAEVAALTSAYDHARKATLAYQNVHRAEAADEHQHASVDFARAAKGTNDSEALRVLNLLEAQHRKLAQIIKDQDATQQDHTSDEPSSVEPPANTERATRKPAPPEQASPSNMKTPQHPASMVGTRVGTQRDSSPSLAREMASRRGIPQPVKPPSSAAAQARARQRSPETNRAAQSRGTTQLPPSVRDLQADALQVKRAKSAADDDGFAKFYNNLTTGTMSKLSSVLAYAGLPLNDEEASPDQGTNHRGEKRTVSAAYEPDVKKIFSKAALDAIEDEHRQQGTLGHGFGPAESFYVVQKGGGTYSYADIARAHQQQLVSGGGGGDEEAEFVDAREVQGQAPSPKASRFSQSQRDSFGNPRTNEELDLENATLKQTLQDLAGRLAAFEAHAQDASFAALTQSVANLRPTTGDGGLQERILQLEKQVEGQAEERQRLESVASKQEKTLKKYQAKFEEIKKSAREKDRVRKDKAVREAESSTADVPEAT